MAFVPSPQQAAFINEALNGTSSIVLIAVAGAGKTSTILQAVGRMRGSSIIIAFGKRIAEEIKGKLKQMGIDWKKAEASTVHAIGLRNYRKKFPAVRRRRGQGRQHHLVLDRVQQDRSRAGAPRFDHLPAGRLRQAERRRHPRPGPHRGHLDLGRSRRALRSVQRRGGREESRRHHRHGDRRLEGLQPGARDRRLQRHDLPAPALRNQVLAVRQRHHRRGAGHQHGAPAAGPMPDEVEWPAVRCRRSAPGNLRLYRS